MKSLINLINERRDDTTVTLEPLIIKSFSYNAY